MATQDGIFTMAARRVGHKVVVASGQSDIASALLDEEYDGCRERVLRAWDWKCARKYATLVLGGTAPDLWDYSYDWPADCLAPRFIVKDDDTTEQEMNYDKHAKIKFERGTDGTDKFIYTDKKDAILAYTFDLQLETLFDADFANALAWLLASEIAIPLTHKPWLVQESMARYTIALNDARASEERDSTPEPRRDKNAEKSDFVNSRLDLI